MSTLTGSNGGEHSSASERLTEEQQGTRMRAPALTHRSPPLPLYATQSRAAQVKSVRSLGSRICAAPPGCQDEEGGFVCGEWLDCFLTRATRSGSASPSQPVRRKLTTESQHLGCGILRLPPPCSHMQMPKLAEKALYASHD